MYDNEPSELNRNGARPKYILLLVDGAGRDWYWRTTDDALLAIDGTEIFFRGHVAPETERLSPEAAVSAIADEHGVTRQAFGTTVLDQLAEAV